MWTKRTQTSPSKRLHTEMPEINTKHTFKYRPSRCKMEVYQISGAVFDDVEPVISEHTSIR